MSNLLRHATRVYIENTCYLGETDKTHEVFSHVLTWKKTNGKVERRHVTHNRLKR